ncbi:MAG: hypothetical protein ACWGQW_26375, partial [bacterium]
MQTGYHSYAFEVPAYGIYTRSWRDGKLIAISDDTLTMGNGGANDDVTFGNFYQATYNEPLAGRIFCLYWFYGFLTDAEVRQLHCDPYAMFQRERRVSILTPLSKFWPEDVASLRYSRGNYSTLPTDDADLEDDFEGKDYEAVEADDNVYVLQSADGEHAIFEFKEQHTNRTDPIAATWKGKTTKSGGGRIIRAPGWQKPIRGTLLDTSHPLARGLKLCLLMNEGTGNRIHESVNHLYGSLVTGPTWVAGNV